VGRQAPRRITPPPHLAEHSQCLYVCTFQPSSPQPDPPAKELALPRTGNRGQCHADYWLLGRLITFCIGAAIAVVIAWQSCGDIARLGGTPATREPWMPEQAPMFEPQGPDSTVVAPYMVAPFQPPPNETIAPQGELTGKDHSPVSPAERLGLIGVARAKHEKCLADAVYFEARGEPVRGQMAVAQVVINRVFSGYYPSNICGVVYQNAHRHLRCQFTFACDGRPERVHEPAAWERAQHIARDALDGNFWLNDVGKATHYRAPWVHPRWVRKMRKLDRIGVHTFYRPRNWGDGSNSLFGKAP
jgi:cell wall hydrolase